MIYIYICIYSIYMNQGTSCASLNCCHTWLLQPLANQVRPTRNANCSSGEALCQRASLSHYRIDGGGFVRETLQRIHRKLLGFTWFYMVLKFYYITSFDNISFKPSVGHLEQALGM